MSHTGYVGQTGPTLLQPLTDRGCQQPWLGTGEGRELAGASSSIIHGEISADGPGAFRGWFLMEPADVSHQ